MRPKWWCWAIMHNTMFSENQTPHTNCQIRVVQGLIWICFALQPQDPGTLQKLSQPRTLCTKSILNDWKRKESWCYNETQKSRPQPYCNAFTLRVLCVNRYQWTEAMLGRRVQQISSKMIWDTDKATQKISSFCFSRWFYNPLNPTSLYESMYMVPHAGSVFIHS